jgi:hypothetical protein
MLQLQFGILPPGSTVKFYGPDPGNKADGFGPEILPTVLYQIWIV